MSLRDMAEGIGERARVAREQEEAVRAGLESFADNAERANGTVTYGQTPTALDIEAAKRNGWVRPADGFEPVRLSDMLAGPEESGIPAEQDVPVHVAWSRVMGEVQYIAKGRTTTSGARYNYRGIDDVLNAVAGAFRKHGVAVIPSGVEPVFEVIKTSSGSAMNYARVVCHFTIYGPKGDTMPGSVLGEGFDSGDKSGTKAQSVAYRTFLIEALAIPVDRPEYDTEHGPQHEIAGPQRRTPAEYAGVITAEATSMDMLRQIWQELNSDPVTARSAVQTMEGNEVMLIDLLNATVKRRQGAA